MNNIGVARGWKQKLAGKKWADLSGAEREATIFMPIVIAVLLPLYVVMRLAFGTLPELWEYGAVSVVETFLIVVIFSMAAGVAAILILERGGAYRHFDSALASGAIFGAGTTAWDAFVVGFGNVSYRAFALNGIAETALMVAASLLAIRIAAGIVGRTARVAAQPSY
ncbi:MAG: hypothetical protein WA549_04510 [Thermoplasmata archaeon]